MLTTAQRITAYRRCNIATGRVDLTARQYRQVWRMARRAGELGSVTGMAIAEHVDLAVVRRRTARRVEAAIRAAGGHLAPAHMARLAGHLTDPGGFAS